MSPKPSFPEVIKPEEAWNFVHYPRTLKTWHPSPKLTLFETPRKVERSGSRLNVPVTRILDLEFIREVLIFEEECV
jgi:hypothetical protein